MKTSSHIMETKALYYRGEVDNWTGLHLQHIDRSFSYSSKPTQAQIRARRENIRKAQAERWG